ncbi:MAG: PEP-utilizing enzyme [Patescibacteria group bacterium]|nr:PEP-utilizing enzyme [Patescibacteria group bacterium]
MRYVKLWAKRAYPLYLMAMASRGATAGLAKIFPESKLTNIYNFYTNGYTDYIFEEEEIVETVNAICEKGLKDPEFLYSIFKTSYAKSIKLHSAYEKYKNQNLTKIKTEELIQVLEDFYEEFCDFYAYGGVSILVGYIDDNPIYKKAESLLRDKLKNSPDKFTEYWMALTLPPKNSTKEQREMEVLKIAEKAKKQGIKGEKAIAKKFKKELDSLMKDFDYISFDLFDALLCDLDCCIEDVAKAVEEDVEKRIGELNNYEKNTQKEFEKICQELKLSPEEKECFELIRNTGYYKWAREYEFMGALYNIKNVQDELGKRGGLISTESKYILPSDLKDNLKDLTKLKKIARDRIICSICIAERSGRVSVYSGEEAKKIYASLDFFKEETDFQGSEIKGTPAYAGKAQGIVRIVNFVRHIDKMEEGNILVSAATNPNLLSAMQKASAFITDEGGITCHAAIVARELKKPCITGTKIATRVLHDGDLVEVDANTGVVTLIG